jgi:WD40 repeat protein
VRPITQLGNYITRPNLQGLAFTPQGLNRLAFFTNDNQISIYDIGLSESLNTDITEVQIQEVKPIYPNPDLEAVNGLLAIGYDSESNIRTAIQSRNGLNVSTINTRFTDNLPSDDILNVALGLEGMVATTHRFGIQVWDPLTRMPIWDKRDLIAPALSLAFSPDAKYLAAGWCRTCVPEESYQVSIFEISSENVIYELKSYSIGEIASLEFSSAGNFLAGGGTFGRIEIWNLQTSAPLELPLIWTGVGNVTAVTFSPDGHTLASGDQFGNLALWDVASRQQIGQTIKADEAPVTGLLFATDGLSLISASQNGRIQRWDLDPQSWIKRLCSLAGREFTEDEFRVFFPDKDYSPTCGVDSQPTDTPSP